MQIRRFISAYRWPLFLTGILGMSVAAQGVLVFVATRPDSPRPIADYYVRGLAWEADAALVAASGRLGWSVEVEVPAGQEYDLAARRPVDVTVRDGEGQPVRGLTGRLVAVRPADTRLNGESPRGERPHEPGRSRPLARRSAAGLGELRLDARRGETHFVHTERVVVGGGSTP